VMITLKWILGEGNGRVWTANRDQWQVLVNNVITLQFHKRQRIS
jgi:hypothetical protein